MPYKDPEVAKQKAAERRARGNNREIAKQRSKEWYENNKKYALERQQKYYLENREERLEFGKAWRQTPEGKASRRKTWLKQVKNNPKQYHCNNLFKAAVRRGRIKRKPCEICGDGNSQGHHEDYTKPYEVRWLCDTHHKEVEGKLV